MVGKNSDHYFEHVLSSLEVYIVKFMLYIPYKDVIRPLLEAFGIHFYNITIEHATLRIQIAADISNHHF